jgi:hypothetical protein
VARRATSRQTRLRARLWSELAYQLLDAQGCVLVAQADKAGVNPGSDGLRALFDLAAPWLVRIDRRIAYARQLYGVSGFRLAA